MVWVPNVRTAMALLSTALVFSLHPRLEAKPQPTAAPAAPKAQPAAPAGGFRVVETTSAGKVLLREAADGSTPEALLRTALAELERYFGARPQIRGAYKDLRSGQSGVAGFAVPYQGKRVDGLVFGRVAEGHSRVVVVMAWAGTGQSDWGQLLRRGPAIALDDLAVVPVATPLAVQNETTTVLSYGITEALAGGSQRHYRALATVSSIPMPPTNYFLRIDELKAPDAIFERDLPTMQRIAESWRVVPSVIAAQGQANVQQQQAWFKQHEAMMNAKYASAYEQNEQWNAAHRSAAAGRGPNGGRAAVQTQSSDDVDEYIRGTRTVLDTQTGLKTSVDLRNVAASCVKPRQH
jgi:hypothetical protein